MAFGRALRDRFGLRPDAAFLNHGSYGACPSEVLAEQDRVRREMEAHPDGFFRHDIMPREDGSRLRKAAEELAAFVKAGSGHVAFVENATTGTQAVLRSIDFRPGDEILMTSHVYNAVRLQVERRCAETGAKPRMVDIPIPTTADEIVARVRSAAAPGVRLAILDHITSPTALVFPLERIIPELRRHGAMVLVDGAHGIGQLDLDLAALDADWYVTNAHKWLYAPRGTALLHAADRVAGITRPNVVSHFDAMRFPDCFDYVGTRDNSGWLAAPAAMRFFTGLDAVALRNHQSRVIEFATQRLGLAPICPISLCAAMRSFAVSRRAAVTEAEARSWMRSMWKAERIQSCAMVYDGKLLVRVSVAAYNDEEDIERLANAITRLGWPGS